MVKGNATTAQPGKADYKLLTRAQLRFKYRNELIHNNQKVIDSFFAAHHVPNINELQAVFGRFLATTQQEPTDMNLKQVYHSFNNVMLLIERLRPTTVIPSA